MADRHHPPFAALREHALQLLAQAVDNELRSGYDEGIGVAALGGARTALDGSSPRLSRRAYVKEVLEALLAHMRYLDAHGERGEYSNGSSSVGSFARAFAQMARQHGIDVEIDVSTGYLQMPTRWSLLWRWRRL